MNKYITQIILLLLCSFTVHAGDQGKIVEEKYISDYGISLPVNDQWTLGGSSGGSLPCLVHRISDDQVLNIVFIPDDHKGDTLTFTEGCLEGLSDNDGFKLRKEILVFDTDQDVEAFYFECEMNDSEGLPYRYGYHLIDVSTGLLLTISITEASQDPDYMQLAYDMMKKIELSPDLLAKPDSGILGLGENIGMYIVLAFLVIFAIRLLTRVLNKNTNQRMDSAVKTSGKLGNEQGTAGPPYRSIEKEHMEFLPIEKDFQNVYAGFGSRFGAGLIDALILLPLSYLFLWLEGFDRTLALIITIPSSILFSMYNVYFNARFGGTIGKLARGIKVTKPDGSKIGWSEAWKRSSVDLVYAGLLLFLEVQALLLINPDAYSNAVSFVERVTLLQEHYPAWYSNVYPVYQIWIWSEVFVVLFNKRKRAIHDFIGGTVVIHKQFAEPELGADTVRRPFEPGKV